MSNIDWKIFIPVKWIFYGWLFSTGTLVYICMRIAGLVGNDKIGFWSEGIKPDCILQPPALLSLCKLSS